ncbi:MAG: hypothetical protein P4L36_15400 [Holophaga sp.]|nr:hypothetical protein [Holophaga sp.]
MKKAPVISACVVAAALAVGGGLRWALQRPPSTAPEDDQGSGFTVQTSGSGQLITFQDAQIPLRALRWLAPLPNGILAAQMLGQNDRQRVVLFHDGTQDSLLVLKPVGVADGFWRFAELREAAMAPDGMLLLLYRAGDPNSHEAPLALGLDVTSQQVKWFRRGAFSHLAVAQGPQSLVYLYGAKGPIQRLTLKPGYPSEAVELPAEISELDDLLPTGGGFLVSHPNGLSAYRGKQGWTHYPAPESDGPPCVGWKSSLARTGKTTWWQPVPGKLVKLRPDGQPDATSSWQLRPEDPFAPDVHLLRMLGAAPDGWIWFALASPAPAAPGASPAAPGAAAAPGAPPASSSLPVQAPDPAAPPVPATDWGLYAAAGLDRMYRWNPARNALERVALKQAWAALNPPAAVQMPLPGQGVAPAAGSLLAEGIRCAWWLPLAALPCQPVLQAM